MIEGVKEDINLILRFRNEKPEEIVDRVNRLGELVHPYELLGILFLMLRSFSVKKMTILETRGWIRLQKLLS